MSPPNTVMVTTDASIEGWGSHAQGSEIHSTLFYGLLAPEEKWLHINVLALRAVCLMLDSLKQTLLSQIIQIESDNLINVAYINKEGRVHSRSLNQEAMLLYDWVVPMGAQFQAV